MSLSESARLISYKAPGVSGISRPITFVSETEKPALLRCRSVCIINDEPNDAKLPLSAIVKARTFMPFSESIFVALVSRPGLFSANSVICFNSFFCDHSRLDLVSLNLSQVDDLLRLS